MKKTPVEWLVNQLEKHYTFQDIKNTTAFVIAKEIEKKEIVEAWELGKCLDGFSGEHYYNKTFNTNEK